MEPQRQPRATMTDLIDRVMDKGVVVRLDLIVGLAGIPLIGISLHAAIAAMETMLQYGMMEDWDSRTRALEDGQADWRQLALRPGEQIQAELYGSYHDTEGIWRVWRPGRLLLTDQRLLLIRPVPRQTLFAAQVSAIAGLGRIHRENIAGGGRDMTCLALADGTLAALYTAEADVLEAWLADRLQRLGRTVTELSPADVGSLGSDVAAGQLWHRWQPGDGQPQWKSGWAALTADELTWRADVGPGVLLRLPLAQLGNLTVERRELGSLGVRDVLVVRHGDPGRPAEALFTGENVAAWPQAIRRAADRGTGSAMLDLEGDNLRQGLMALVVALLEVVKEALVHAAVGRVEGGRLSDAEIERLGDALAELEDAVEAIKAEHGVTDAVRNVRDDLDGLVGDLIQGLAGGQRREETQRAHA